MCVFEISGTIDLRGDRSYSSDIDIRNPYLTIAGQTAPSPGITIYGKQFKVRTHDVLIQHIRIRGTDDPKAFPDPRERHALEIIGTSKLNYAPHRIVLDHVSLSWGIDETFTAKEEAYDISLLNSIVAEGLKSSLHPKGDHSMAVMATANRISIIRNIIASSSDRTPLDSSPNSIIVNNLIYNDRSSGVQLETVKRNTSIVGNVRIRGPDSRVGFGVYLHGQVKGSRIYVADSVCEKSDDDAWPCVRWKNAGVENLDDIRASTPPVWLPGLLMLHSSDVEARLLNSAGARPNDRDSVDRRIIREIRTRTGRIPDCVGGQEILYPSGKVEGAAEKGLRIELKQCVADRYNGLELRITSGKGAGQSRKIVAQDCQGPNIELDAPWTILPAPNSRFAIVHACRNNAGGLPRLAVNKRMFRVPKRANEILASGYTRLEELLHQYSRDLERVSTSNPIGIDH